MLALEIVKIEIRVTIQPLVDVLFPILLSYMIRLYVAKQRVDPKGGGPDRETGSLKVM